MDRAIDLSASLIAMAFGVDVERGAATSTSQRSASRRLVECLEYPDVVMASASRLGDETIAAEGLARLAGPL
jgi:hypothetical protein